MKHIAIHSVPRSGSTWLGNIFNSHPQVAFRYQPLFSYAFKGYLTNQSTKEEIEDFFRRITNSKDSFINQAEGINKGIIPNLKKEGEATHCCYKEVRYHYVLRNMLQEYEGVKLVLLVRNPLSILYSWYKAPKEFKKEQGWRLENEWLHAPSKNLDKVEEYNGYIKWKEATGLFLELKQDFADRVYFLEYRDLLKDPVSITKALFHFSDLNYHSQVGEFIDQSTTNHDEDAYSVYKIKSRDDHWKQLPRHIIDYIVRDLKNTSLEQFIDE